MRLHFYPHKSATRFSMYLKIKIRETKKKNLEYLWRRFFTCNVLVSDTVYEYEDGVAISLRSVGIHLHSQGVTSHKTTM
jgi:hypothetical protein